MNEEWSRFVRWPPLFMAAVLWLMAFPAWAGPGVTYHGRLLRPDGRPVDSSNVRFKIQIRTPELPSCLMYEEIQTRDLSDSQGMFSLTIGQNASTPNAEPFTLEQVFSNTGKALTFPAGHCTGISTVTLNPTDGRQILVSFNDDSFSGWEELPPEIINLVPSAFEAVTVGGIRGSQLFRVEDGSGAPQTMAPWSVSAYGVLTGLVGSATVSGGAVTGISGTASGFTGALAGDVSGAQGATRVGALQGRAVGNLSPSDGQVLTWNQGASHWEPATLPSGGGGSGSVTSVDLTVPSYMSASGGPITGSGSIDLSFGSQAQNLVFASPVTGAGAPSFRTLQIRDIRSSFSGAFLTASGACPVGESLTYLSASDTLSCQAYSVTSAQVTSALGFTPMGTADLADYVEKAGDTMTGALHISRTVGNEDVLFRVQDKDSGFGSGLGQVIIGDIATNNTNQFLPALTFVPAEYGNAYLRTIVEPAQDTASGAAMTIQGRRSSGANLQTLNLLSVVDGAENAKFVVGPTGHVGIGAVSPTEKLEVAGKIKVTGPGNGIVFPDGTTQTTAATGGGGGGGDLKSDGTVTMAADFDLGGYGLVDNVLNSVKIGDGADDVIEMNGKVNFHGMLNTNGYALTNDAGAGYLILGDSDDTIQVSGQMEMFGKLNMRGYAIVDDGGTGHVILGDGVDDQILLRGSVQGLEADMTTPEDIVFQASGGNVGIGLSNPSEKLTVGGNIQLSGLGHGLKFPDGTTQTTAATGGGDFKKDGSVAMTGAFKASTGSASAPSISFAGDTDTGWYSPAANHLGASAGGAERLRIDSSGQVGIGTINPQALLDVAGKIRAQEICDEAGANCKDISAGWGSGASSLSGDVSGDFGTTSVDAIKGKSVVPVAYSSGQVLRYDGTNWVNAVLDLGTDVTGTLSIARGGTGATSRAGAINALLPPQGGNTNKILKTDGLDVSWVDESVGGLTNFTESVNTMAPNTTTPVAALTANNAATNVDLALQPKGSGALSRRIADGTMTGGNKRGSGAVDWQNSRVLATQVASGTSSSITGGYQNTASGSFSTVAGGSANTASDMYSMVGGGESNTASGQHTFIGSGQFNTASGQYSVILGGGNNSTSGQGSLASGFYTTTSARAQVTFGQYNLPKGGENGSLWVATDPLFVLGNGSSSATRSNALMILKNGNIGVGITSPTQKLDVAGNARMTGQLTTGSSTLTGGTNSIDWNQGNAVSTDYNCGSAIDFANLADGGTYTLVVTDGGTTQCSFSTTVTGTGAGTVQYKFKPANTTRTASSYTVYTFLRVGTIVLVSWGSGFQ